MPRGWKSSHSRNVSPQPAHGREYGKCVKNDGWPTDELNWKSSMRHDPGEFKTPHVRFPRGEASRPARGLEVVARAESLRATYYAGDRANADVQPAADRNVSVDVVGAGINGLGIAQDAAARGLSVVVLEKDDLCSGVSAWSGRLVHGGLRYLEHRDFALVRESLRERERLFRNAPHLVKPVRLLMPAYAHNRRPAWLIRLGMIAYDLLSFDKKTKRHEALNLTRTVRRFPGISRQGLTGSVAFTDGQVEAANRRMRLSRQDSDEATVAIGFVDLVGFTPLSRRLDDAELGIAGDYERVPLKPYVRIRKADSGRVITSSQGQSQERGKCYESFLHGGSNESQ